MDEGTPQLRRLARALVLPLGALGAVFQRDAFGGETVADLVGQGKLAGGAELGTDGYQQVNERSGGQFLSLIHISEPTRRTPISYAVFCLKKKKL